MCKRYLALTPHTWDWHKGYNSFTKCGTGSCQSHMDSSCIIMTKIISLINWVMFKISLLEIFLYKMPVFIKKNVLFPSSCNTCEPSSTVEPPSSSWSHSYSAFSNNLASNILSLHCMCFMLVLHVFFYTMSAFFLGSSTFQDLTHLSHRSNVLLLPHFVYEWTENQRLINNFWADKAGFYTWLQRRNIS